MGRVGDWRSDVSSGEVAVVGDSAGINIILKRLVLCDLIQFFREVEQSSMIKDMSFDDSEIFSNEIPGDCEARGVVMPEKEVGAGWVDDTLSTSTCKF